jgi:hypothetical protein
MERYFSTGQSPQRAVAPTEEEEELGCPCILFCGYKNNEKANGKVTSIWKESVIISVNVS